MRKFIMRSFILSCFAVVVLLSQMACALTPSQTGAVGGSQVIESGGGGSYPTGSVVYLCASDASSYSGSGETWANLIPSPADGASQTDYNFSFGDTTSTEGDEATFTGTAGVPGAYMDITNGDEYFNLTAATNPEWYKTMHKTTGGQGWMGFVVYLNGLASAQILFEDRGTDGVQFFVDTSGHIVMNVRQNTGANESITSTGTISASTPTFVFASWDVDGGSNNVRININSATEEYLTLTDPADGDQDNTTNDAGLGANESGSAGIDSGGRIYAYIGGNTFADDTVANAAEAIVESCVGTSFW